MPPSKAATTARPSTGANPNKSALHSVRIGLPPASETNRSWHTIFSDPAPRCTYPLLEMRAIAAWTLAIHPYVHAGRTRCMLHGLRHARRVGRGMLLLF